MEIYLNNLEEENKNNIISKEENNFCLSNINSDINIETLKILIESKQIKIEEEKNLKFLLSLTLKHKNSTSNDIKLLNYLISFLNENNKKIYIDYSFQCCELGKENLLKIMLENGININCQNECGETFLHIAISKRDKNLILFLLKYNPNKNLKTFKDKMTVLDYSKENNDKSIIDLIEDSFSEINFNNFNNFNSNDCLNIINLKSNICLNRNLFNNKNNKNNISFNDNNNCNIFVFQSVKNDIKDNNKFYNDINNILFTKKSRFTNTVNSNSNNGEICYFDSITQRDNYFDQIKKIENKCFNNNIEVENKKNKFEDSLEDYNINDNEENQIETYVSFFEDIISKQKFSSNNKKMKQTNSENIITHSNLNSNRLSTFTGNTGINTNNSNNKNNNNNVNKKNLFLPYKNEKKKNKLSLYLISQNDDLNNEYKALTNRENNLKLSTDLNNNNENKNNNSERISFIYNKYIKNENNEKEINNFISEIGLSKKYVNLLLINGFDDLNVLKEQSKNGIAISNENLKEIGFKTPGIRAKFIIHLEEISNLYDFKIDKEKVYFSNITNENKLYRLLSSINLEKYINNFLINDYTSPELLFIQMISKQPLTEDILFNDIGIEKVGYRMRLINKLKNESNNYIYKVKNGIIGNNNFHIKKNSIVLESQKNNNNNNEFCNCIIY